MLSIERVPYRGWPNCYRLSNGHIDLLVTTDVGPRLIWFGFTGRDNEFVEFPADAGQVGGTSWRPYGGHRLWHAPEAMPRTYQPDNEPVQLTEHPGFVRLSQPTEPATGIQKELDIALAPAAAQVVVTHRLINWGIWPVTLAPWALSMMAPGGVAIAPLPPRGPQPANLSATGALALWPYTDLSDPRWRWGRELLLLQQEPDRPAPQKIGLTAVNPGWVAYARRGHLLVKTYTPTPDASYPDQNSAVELFTNDAFLEIETLGPLVTLAVGTAVTHRETWHLLDDIPQPDSPAAAAALLPAIQALTADL